MPETANPVDLKWLLDDLVARVAEVATAIVLSADGILMAAAGELGRDDAEHLAAVAAGCQSLSRGTSQRFSKGAVRQTLIEMDSAFLFVTAAGHGACLAVLSDAHADTGFVAYEMALLVERVGTYLSSPDRAMSSGTEGT